MNEDLPEAHWTRFVAGVYITTLETEGLQLACGVSYGGYLSMAGGIEGLVHLIVALTHNYSIPNNDAAKAAASVLLETCFPSELNGSL